MILSFMSFTVLSKCFSWMFYENAEYNLNKAGQVYWVHGLDICVNFPENFAYKVQYIAVET